MKSARFLFAGVERQGVVQPDGRLLAKDGTQYHPDEVRWLPPTSPTKVIGLALNYAQHAAELDMPPPPEPALFFKPLSSLVGDGAAVVYPEGVKYMHYEVELVVVIGQRCRRVSQAEAWQVIAGFTIGNDVTVRDFVGDFYRPPVRAKGYDTFGPVGPYLVSRDEIVDPAGLELRAYVNDELRQRGNTGHLLRPIPELIEFISEIMTLEPGDMIWTGTPQGISPVHPGDVMRLEIDGLGVLTNPVVPETRRDEEQTRR